MFSQLTDSLESTLKNLRGQGKLTEENVAESLREVRRAFLEADVNFNVTRDFVKAVKEKAMGSEVLTSVTPGQQIVKIIHDELVAVMGGETKEINLSGPAPVGIMMAGLQGSGKTTFAGKIALWMRSKKKRKPLLVAADVYRPAAIKQLQVLGKSIGIPVYDEGQGDPVEIIKHGYQYAKDNGFDLVIYDTAGRLQIDEELMQELEKAKEAVHPDEILFVADAMIGQEAVNVAETFWNRLNFTGEKLSDIELFHPDRMASRILGMGDVVSLVEKAQQVIDEKDAKDLKKKILNNTFDLNDFLNQLRTIKKLGRIKDILSLIPGLNKLPIDQIDEKELVYVEAVLSSMTPKERKKPDILDGSRKARVAKGSGTEIGRVNAVLKQYETMKEMFKKVGDMARRQNNGGQVGSNYTPPKDKKKKKKK